jgi:signal transduction histidine kinase
MDTAMEAAPSGRVTRYVARGAFFFTILLVVATGLLLALNRPKDLVIAWIVWVFLSIGCLLYSGVGALIVARLPRNPIGWLLCAIGVALIYAEFVEQYALRALWRAPGSLPVPKPLASVAVGPVFALPAIALLFLLFPDGRPPSPRWRPVLWATVAVTVFGTIGFLSLRSEVTGLTNSLADAHVQFTSTIGVFDPNGPISAPLAITGFVGVACGLSALASLFVRRRRANPEERQQLAWLGYVGLLALLVIVVSFLYQVIFRPGDNSLAVGLLFLSLFTILFVGIPIACGVSVLHYHLYDLDVVVKKTLVFGALAAIFTGVYVAIVVGIGALVGHRVSSALTFAAAAVVALAFNPFRVRARRLADRLVYGQRATPYEVMSSFAERLGETYSTDDVLPRMATILRNATGASRAEVWLRVGGEYRLAGLADGGSTNGDGPDREPVKARGEELPAFDAVDGSFPVRDRGETLGALAVAMPAAEPLTGSTERLIGDLASQAGLVLRNVRLIEELRASRERLVTAQDEERRRLERNIHDGAQQQLVALAVKLRLARGLMANDATKADAMLEQTGQELNEALDTLRELARGIYPPLLADRGLAEALRAQVRKAAVAVEVDADGVGRYPQNAEAAVYFCCLEALQNVAKYARATKAVVRLRQQDGALMFEVEDDGVGFDQQATAGGTGVQGMIDRLEAVGGTLELKSAPGEGTTVFGRLPVAAVDVRRD